jgi:DNA-binding SARP family transcriptional activator/tetratricopeptide (TPR) repeat protein
VALIIRLLGDLLVTRGGRPVVLPASKRTRALLGFLVATGTAQTRQSLCDLLWDGPDDPRAALRWSLTKLRNVVNDDHAIRLEADRERVGFRPREAQIDIAAVKTLLPGGVAAADIAALEAAAPLLAGEFLDGLDLPTCPRFHHWCMAEREAMGALRRGVLGELVQRLRDQPARALAHARALVAADPLSETAHASLIRLLTQTGRTDDAEAHCRRAAEMLRQEVGASQAEVLRSALRESRMRRPAADPPRPSQSTALPAMVGRETECALIDSAVAALTVNAAPTPLLFVGVPGIGKTRLLDAMAAAASGAHVLCARCFEAEMVRPYGCIADALRLLPPAFFPAALHGRLAALLPDLGPLASGTDRAGLLDSIAELLRGLAARRPVLLLLDDLQWLDEASAALLHVLVRRAIPRVLVAGAARVGELDDNPWAKRLAQSLARAGLMDIVPVGALSPTETARLTGAAPGSAEATEAFRQSGGNPLLVLELTQARVRGSASLGGHGIAALIADQLSRLSDEEQEVLVAAAVVGGEFRLELLEAVLGQTGAALLGRIARLERLGVLRATANGQFDFTHDLIRQGIYRLQSQPHRRFLHRQIARTLATVAADEPSLYGDLVHHAGLAEDHAVAANACLATAEHCLRVFANAEAAATAERGLAHLQRLSVTRERICQTIALLSVRTFSGVGSRMRDTGALLDAMEKACDNAELAGLFAEAAHAQHTIAWLLVSTNDTVRAEKATLRAEQISRTADVATRCHQLANTGRCLLEVDSDGPSAIALIDEANALAKAHNLRFVELEWGRALAARWRGDLAEAATLMAHALGFARIREDRWRESECLGRLAGIALERGELAEAAVHCAEIQAVMARMALPSAPFAQALDALVHVANSQPGAELAVQAGLAALRAADDKARLAYLLNAWATLLLERDELPDADAAAAEAASLAVRVRQPTEVAVAWALRTCIAAIGGDHASASAHLAAAQSAIDASAVSARARQYFERAVSKLAAIPTLSPTHAA